MSLCLLTICITFPAFCGAQSSNTLPKGFVYLHTVDNSIDQKLDFSTDDNCVGQPLNGYEGNQAICTLALAKELKKVQASLKKTNSNYALRVLDAYRPTDAVDHIKRWAADPNDQKTKEKCYPDLEKKDLLGKYVAACKSAHSRGSTVDVIIIDVRTGEPLDFGPDFFGDYAHINYVGLTDIQKNNRLALRKLMLMHKFKPYDAEFWHFTLKDEPFPKTYFNFTIRNQS